MRAWKIERISTFSDEELADKLNSIESDTHKKIKEVVYMGDNSLHVRIYQIIYVEE